jgi:hypothetical protein
VVSVCTLQHHSKHPPLCIGTFDSHEHMELPRASEQWAILEQQCISGGGGVAVVVWHKSGTCRKPTCTSFSRVGDDTLVQDLTG